MRNEPNMRVERFRDLGTSTPKFGNNGHFKVVRNKVLLFCRASNGLGWEHVSVSVRNREGNKQAERCPTWEEMVHIRNLFWADDEWVMQLNPPPSRNISRHPFVLHLWRPLEGEIPIPDRKMV